MFWRFSRRFEVQNLRSRFSHSPNMNLSMRFRSGELLNRTLNPWSGPGLDPVLEVREPDHSQSKQSTQMNRAHTILSVHKAWSLIPLSSAEVNATRAASQ